MKRDRLDDGLAMILGALLGFLLARGVFFALAHADDLDLPVQLERPPAPATAPSPPDDYVPPAPEVPIFGGLVPAVNDRVVFVLDRSGSMMVADRSHPHESRMLRAKREVSEALLALPPHVEVNILAFDHRGDLAMPQLAQLSDVRTVLLQWLEGITFRGSTQTGPYTAQARDMVGDGVIILITDGVPSGDPDEHIAMIVRHGSAPVYVFGIGVSAHPTARPFCVAVATQTGGEYADVD